MADVTLKACRHLALHREKRKRHDLNVVRDKRSGCPRRQPQDDPHSAEMAWVRSVVIAGREDDDLCLRYDIAETMLVVKAP